MKESRKIQILRHIQDAIGREERPRPPAVGLSEKEFEELADADLLQLSYSKPESELTWVDYTIDGISDEAKGLIANSVSLPKSRASKIARVLAIGLWDLAKIAVGVLIGWYLKKYHP